MKCEFADDLTAYLHEDLSPTRRRVVQKHLETCSDCAGTLGVLRQTMDELAFFPAREPSPKVRQAVIRRLDETMASRWGRLLSWLRESFKLRGRG